MLLNALLDWKTIQTDFLFLIGLTMSFLLFQAQEAYFVPHLYAVESLTFNIDVVRYPTDFTTRRRYFGSSRVDNIQALPFNWTFNRKVGGGTIYMFSFRLATIPLRSWESLAFRMWRFKKICWEQAYDSIRVLSICVMHWLQYMCSEYGIMFNPESKQILRGIHQQLLDITT